MYGVEDSDQWTPYKSDEHFSFLQIGNTPTLGRCQNHVEIYSGQVSWAESTTSRSYRSVMYCCGKGITLFENWKLSFEIMPTAINSGQGDMIRVESGSDRIPAVFFEGTSALSIRTILNENQNYGNDQNLKTPSLPLYKWSRVQISQNEQLDGSFDFIVQLNGREIHRAQNDLPERYDNVRVNDLSVGKHDAAFAKIRNIQHKTSPSRLVG